MEQPLKIICRVITLKHYLKQGELKKKKKKQCSINRLETKGRKTKEINKTTHLSPNISVVIYIKGLAVDF